MRPTTNNSAHNNVPDNVALIFSLEIFMCNEIMSEESYKCKMNLIYGRSDCGREFLIRIILQQSKCGREVDGDNIY